MVPGEGFEPPTNGLQNRCSTPELTRPILRRRPACAPAGKIAHHIASSPAEQKLGETGKRDRIAAFLAPERPEAGPRETSRQASTRQLQYGHNRAEFAYWPSLLSPGAHLSPYSPK